MLYVNLETMYGQSRNLWIGPIGPHWFRRKSQVSGGERWLLGAGVQSGRNHGSQYQYQKEALQNKSRLHHQYQTNFIRHSSNPLNPESIYPSQIKSLNPRIDGAWWVINRLIINKLWFLIDPGWVMFHGSLTFIRGNSGFCYSGTLQEDH